MLYLPIEYFACAGSFQLALAQLATFLLDERRVVRCRIDLTIGGKYNASLASKYT
jgi:hypothetical protein